jgi:hypothetical protein
MTRKARLSNALYDAKESCILFTGIVFSGIYVTGLIVSDVMSMLSRGIRPSIHLRQRY